MIINNPAENRPIDTGIAVFTSSRILSLDVLRGLGVLAALFVSIWVFGGLGEEQQKQYLLHSTGWNYRMFVTIDLFLNGKMRALIAIVFGASMFLFLSKKTVGSKPAGDVFINRQLWLLLFGILNAVLLLWTHDLLFHLGIMGILLFPFVRLSNRVLLIAAVLITLISCGKNYWNYSDDKEMYQKYLVVTALEKKFDKDSIAKAKAGNLTKKDTLTKLQKQDKSAWEGRLASIKPDLKKDSTNIKALQVNDYGKIWSHLLPAIQSRQAEWTYKTGIWELGSMIFVGILLFKIGFFNIAFSRHTYLVVGLLCLTAGLLFGWFRVHHHQIAMQDYLKYIRKYTLPNTFFIPLEKGMMAIAYTSFTMLLLPTKFLNVIWRTLAIVGKLALSNYLLQTILSSIFFYGYGMGYYGRLNQWELYFFAAEVIIIQVALSIIWLKYYHSGPAEWLIRRLSSKEHALHNERAAHQPETVTASIT